MAPQEAADQPRIGVIATTRRGPDRDGDLLALVEVRNGILRMSCTRNGDHAGQERASSAASNDFTSRLELATDKARPMLRCPHDGATSLLQRDLDRHACRFAAAPPRPFVWSNVAAL